MNALLPFTFGLIAILVGSQRWPNKLPTHRNLCNHLRFDLRNRSVNGCLDVSLDLVNRSARPVFLPTTGLYIDVSAKLLSSVPEKNGTERWLNLYGASDVVPILNVKPLPPGVADHEGHCVSSTVDVVDPGSQVWREVPVRGRLKISVQYFVPDPKSAKGTEEVCGDRAARGRSNHVRGAYPMPGWRMRPWVRRASNCRGK